jgi:hypothetical protein
MLTTLILQCLVTSNLSAVIGLEAFKIAYADDSYIAMSCHPDDFNPTKTKLECTVEDHFGWLKSLGMVVNLFKTEFIIFHPSQYKCVWNDIKNLRSPLLALS